MIQGVCPRCGFQGFDGVRCGRCGYGYEKDDV